MAAGFHTYGPTCRLNDKVNTPGRAVTVQAGESPRLRSHFFYSSPRPIYDPLTPRPLGVEKATPKPPRPFSSFDEAQLEETWQKLHARTAPNPPEPFKAEGGSSVSVGYSRLHVVDMPGLLMKPIYWSPIHDIASVVRGTWFYKDKMTPIEPDIANLLEAGYLYMRPWTETYKDEIRSCLDVGPEAETRLVHRLFPVKADDLERPSSSAIRKDEAGATSAILDVLPSETRSAGKIADWADSPKYSKSDSVIYADAREAQILRQNQLPSVSRGRKPLKDIVNRNPVGVQVVRGFSYKIWDKLNPRKATVARQARVGTMRRPRDAKPVDARNVCHACQAEETRPVVSDLILVIHGIGQKLSERIESYNFTHSINELRRAMAIELQSDVISNVVRETMGGVMVLPVNWRANLHLAEGDDSELESHNDLYSIKDITPSTIPGVRSLVSDVLLDIPYYLSHHKPKMIAAVVAEANRVYRLWCQNNPSFHQAGRVHIIAHSLGSVMALDILSNQPTSLPADLDPTTEPDLQIADRPVHFTFDTKNLFFAGSPAGLFLLLNRAQLVPRRGRQKAGSEGIDTSGPGLGEQGTYGCLAVDNIYNIMHYVDPIAYRINATVDVAYAASLAEASVPASGASWAQTFGSLFGGHSIERNTTMARAATIDRLSAAATADLRSHATSAPARATGVMGDAGRVRPGLVEMDTHHFSKEELAERSMLLLNDNGQLDWFLGGGGWEVGLQYLNMLSAHSSYWVLQDFVRFVLVEVGREPGRGEVLMGIRARRKKSGRK